MKSQLSNYLLSKDMTAELDILRDPQLAHLDPRQQLENSARIFDSLLVKCSFPMPFHRPLLQVDPHPHPGAQHRPRAGQQDLPSCRLLQQPPSTVLPSD